MVCRRSNRRCGALIGLVALTFASGLLALPIAARGGCEGEPGYDALDFWVGDWDVRVGDQPVGTNHIEKVLDSCAILEFWHSARGTEGRSFFYYQPAEQRWKQVWVSEWALRRGGVKEKQLVERHENGAVVFLGEVVADSGSTYFDRTTLTPHDDGTVQQRIEESTDGGDTWVVTFDATYVRR